MLLSRSKSLPECRPGESHDDQRRQQVKRERRAVREKSASEHAGLSRAYEYMALRHRWHSDCPADRQEVRMPEKRTVERRRQDGGGSKGATNEAGEIER